MYFSKSASTPVQYIVALLTTMVALIVTSEVVMLYARYTFLLPVAVALFSAWLGGAGPGLASIALSILFISYNVMPPRASFAVDQPVDIAGLVAFTIVSLFMVSLAATRRRALDRLSEANQSLSQQMIEREHAAQAIRALNEELDMRVRERTRELENALQKLKASDEDLRSANQALAKHAENLVKTNAELERFAYVSSHDLREPLRMVTSYLRLLSRRYMATLEPEAQEFIGYAVEGADRMDQLVRDLLEYGRLGERSKKLAEVDCNEVFDECVRTLHEAIVEADAVITSDTLPIITADKTQIGQLFQNLIANAVKFRSKEMPRIHVSAAAKSGESVFSVADNGIGIEPQYLERVFVIFQRLHTRSEYPGTGIGLAICKKIVDGHGGKIWAESEPGKGSTFFFTLPISSASPAIKD